MGVTTATAIRIAAMDSLITAAGRALRAGDPLGALKRVALRDDPPALALRGIAMAQLGDLARARALLRRAARGFGPKETRGAGALPDGRGGDRAGGARSRLAGAGAGRGAARRSPRTAIARTRRMRGCLQIRRLLLIGRLDEAERALRRARRSRRCRRALAAVARAGGRRDRAAPRADRDGARGAGAARATRRRASRIAALCAEVEHAAQRCWCCRRRALVAAGEARLADARRGRGAARVAGPRRRRLPPRGAREARARAAGAPAGAVRACSARWRRRGRAMCRARCCWSRALSARGRPTSRTARACASRWAGCAASCGRSPRSARPRGGFVLAPRGARATVAVLAPPIESDARAPCWRCSPTARRGRARRWRWRWAPASAPCSARSDALDGRRQGACLGQRPLAPLADAAGRRIRDDACYSRRRCRVDVEMTTHGKKRHEQPSGDRARVRPLPGRAPTSRGVTFDGSQVWFAGGRASSRPSTRRAARRVRALDVPAHAGTAFDGRHLFQIADDRIQKMDPETGAVLVTIPAPGGGGDSGLAWAEGTLWVGQYRDRKIHQIDPADRRGPAHHRVQPLRHRRHLGGRRAVARHLGRRRERDRPGRPRTGEVLARLTCRPGRSSPAWSRTCRPLLTAAAATAAASAPCASRGAEKKKKKKYSSSALAHRPGCRRPPTSQL